MSDLDSLRERLGGHSTSASETLLVCDGCRVRYPVEHRCHGARATVKGEPTGRPCECPECCAHRPQPGDPEAADLPPGPPPVDPVLRPATAAEERAVHDLAVLANEALFNGRGEA